MSIDASLPMTAPLTPEQREAYLVEYQKTQDSAQHHDTLVWSITSLNWVGSALLMGFVLSGLGTAKSIPQKVALIVVSLVGIVLAMLVWCWARQMRGVKVAKYERCKELEALFGMKQHTALTYEVGSHARTYGFLMGLFLFAWCVLVVLVIGA